MAIYALPTNASLTEIDPIFMGEALAGDPIVAEFPIVQEDTSLVMWEQMDSVLGLQAIRGINGDLPRVKALGVSRFQLEPGYYGEEAYLDEQAVTTMRMPGTFASPIAVSTLVAKRQEQLVIREANRLRWLIWNLLQNGLVSVLDSNNVVQHQMSFTLTTVTAAVTWGTFATATPLADFRNVMLKHRGQSALFDTSAKAYMSQSTANNLFSNTNSADLGGRRATGLSSIEGLKDVNELLTKDGLPNIVIYDGFYLDDSGVAQQYIAANTVVVVGRRMNNAKLGNLVQCRNASLGGNPGVFVGSYENPKPPFGVSVFRTHNTGIRLSYPGAICVMNV